MRVADVEVEFHPSPPRGARWLGALRSWPERSVGAPSSMRGRPTKVELIARREPLGWLAEEEDESRAGMLDLERSAPAHSPPGRDLGDGGIHPDSSLLARGWPQASQRLRPSGLRSPQLEHVFTRHLGPKIRS
ncbi:MAG: hypothetical protein CMH57_04240 [Myxococcales bacterium]|nr:hypothetical protein [Myxococcales bacterium]